jgi:hypothetical protein
VVARFPIVGLCIACLVSPPSFASEDAVVATSVRDQLAASVGPGYAHVAKIERPLRHVTGRVLGSPTLAPTATIAVIGTLSDQQVRAILELVGDGSREATRVTGDHEFAVVQIGDPQRDPCCTTTVLFENRGGTWTNLGAVTQSH